MATNRNRDDPLPFFDALRAAQDPSKRAVYPNLPASQTNPHGRPTGAYTGRCKRCQSDNLWDDQSAYGCNNCGAVYSN